MKHFSITVGAKEVIRRQLDLTSMPDPIVWLIETFEGDTHDSDREFDHDNGSLALHEESPPQKSEIAWVLRPCVFPKQHFPFYYLWNIVQIEDFRFFLPIGLWWQMRNGVLDLAVNGLVLKSASGKPLLPRKLPPPPTKPDPASRVK